jgi:DUF971 family protein
LSGYIPLSNIPTGRYAIQMMSEDGGLFEWAYFLQYNLHSQ